MLKDLLTGKFWITFKKSKSSSRLILVPCRPIGTMDPAGSVLFIQMREKSPKECHRANLRWYVYQACKLFLRRECRRLLSLVHRAILAFPGSPGCESWASLEEAAPSVVFEACSVAMSRSKLVGQFKTWFDCESCSSSPSLISAPQTLLWVFVVFCWELYLVEERPEWRVEGGREEQMSESSWRMANNDKTWIVPTIPGSFYRVKNSDQTWFPSTITQWLRQWQQYVQKLNYNDFTPSCCECQFCGQEMAVVLTWTEHESKNGSSTCYRCSNPDLRRWVANNERKDVTLLLYLPSVLVSNDKLSLDAFVWLTIQICWKVLHH